MSLLHTASTVKASPSSLPTTVPSTSSTNSPSIRPSTEPPLAPALDDFDFRHTTFDVNDFVSNSTRRYLEALISKLLLKLVSSSASLLRSSETVRSPDRNETLLGANLIYLSRGMYLKQKRESKPIDIAQECWGTSYMPVMNV